MSKNKETLVKHFDTYSGETSKLVRQLSLAFIAVIWIYRDTKKYEVIPSAFTFPLFLFITTLSIDLLQYVIATIISHKFEKETDFPVWGDNIVNTLFYTKTTVLIWGGILFLARMYRILNLN
ncbi:MAG: hypothetical protein K2X26_09210 [Chitinophagaceae bacterium]|jgi:hypothetical protein|nr:hypothetical protein [Chitinophagaceae bacterium]